MANNTGLEPAPKKRDRTRIAQEYGPFRDPKTISSKEVRDSLRKINPNVDAAIDRIRKAAGMKGV
jgi:hypothetical protein